MPSALPHSCLSAGFPIRDIQESNGCVLSSFTGNAWRTRTEQGITEGRASLPIPHSLSRAGWGGQAGAKTRLDQAANSQQANRFKTKEINPQVQFRVSCRLESRPAAADPETSPDIAETRTGTPGLILKRVPGPLEGGGLGSQVGLVRNIQVY